ncbi:leucine-rich repeat and coiled-coil domain-containing protein 1-like [Ostrea edulis]|uniref:leucine-rich repeat and coiled-coil domain-containing protein 1-like n=1 Tax=Ostrea edulis TaxID=37623 RepID=UPI0024AF2EC5|nr:leucine-rich repeat and coiled-coil domain-containing protein 1-like [Ostrea edulis]
MNNIDFDTTELCLIDSGIKSLLKVPLKQQLQVLNVHSNFIHRIENLSHLKNLKHLDLSANQISKIEGIENLSNVRTINLSCNHLSDVQGLAGLRSLVKINLSYNHITDISGFKSLHGSSHKLSHIELHGNQLSSLQHVIKSLIGCCNLRQLTLNLDGSTNPMCSDTVQYRSKLLTALTQLEALDGVDRCGEAIRGYEVLADIPGLEDYMDFLVSQSSSSVSESKSVDVVTPKIDEALEKFHQRKSGNLSSTEMSVLQSDADTSTGIPAPSGQSVTDQEARLEFLEQQLAELIQGSKVTSRDGTKTTPRKHVAKRDVDTTDESDHDSLRRRSRSPGNRKTRKSRIPSYRKSTVASRCRKEAVSPGGAESSQSPAANSEDTTQSSMKHDNGKSPSAVMVTETKMRDDIKSTYVQFMKELESERERRWKAEQASKKLLNHIQTLQGKAKEGSELKDTAIEATTRLKQALMNEKEARLRLQNDGEKLKEHIRELNRQLKVAKETEESLKGSLRALEEVTAKMERDSLKQQTHEQKKSQDAQMRAAALSRELELTKAISDKQKGQISQLQELLANREHQHREELNKRYSLDSKELQEVISEQVKKAEKNYNMEVKSQNEKVDLLSKQYSDLEDEFRMALQIEANRFKELEHAFQTVSDENAGNKQALLAAQRKDETSASMISELTQLVKEQKGRITELSKAKQEQGLESRDRIQVLEAHVEEARKRMLQMELLKQDKTKLLAQVEAQESVICGLKAERKLWGQELAQQGSSLAQDRGRLESKIEAQSSEIITLKKNLERETDALKIKTKMLEDQTETIRKLKEALIERDEEIKRTREDSLRTQRNLEEQLSEERAAIQDSQETLERLRERKQELKQETLDLKTELEDSKKAHSILNNKWKEKSQLIGQLEKQVTEMRENWESKERKLTEERDKAIQAANIAIGKLKTVDDAFRHQLESKEMKHREDMAQLEDEKQMELEQANQRIAAVEDEMRELLQETQSNKKTMEDKVKRLTRAMTELQSDLI